jgi:glycine cleavage system aminomethyltransferase T
VYLIIAGEQNWKTFGSYAQLAIQGPKATEVLQRLLRSIFRQFLIIALQNVNLPDVRM